MRYAYNVWMRAISPNSRDTRVLTTTNPAEVVCDFLLSYVKVWDNLNPLTDCTVLETVTQWEEWCQNEEVKSSMRAEAKSDRPVDTNLKTTAAIGKPKLSDVPPIALFALGAAMSNGASKYGRYNWRTTEVTASVFYDAMQRHLNQWYAGEDFATFQEDGVTLDSGIHHLAHLMAGAAIILDSTGIPGNFKDDRDKSGVRPLNKSIWKNTK